MSTYNRLDLQILGSQTVMPKNYPDHCSTELLRNRRRIEGGRKMSSKKLAHFSLFPFWCRNYIQVAVSSGSKVDGPITTTSMRFGLF